ncbi:hypothetical protein WJX74_003194 [Apatococcus lobatus]|uniref:Carbohydrate kinase PfkB domain-containing protein n=1 Tax=Apatococcus lobatus TaxID=904363 RepID=A0AAW1QLL7_9CHLO
MCRQRCCSASSEVLDKPPRLVGMGGCCLDMLAQVAAFPEPDAKVRTERMETHGGGNAANALTSAARLGLVNPALITKIGNDSVGDQILAELKDDGVDVAHVLRDPVAPSPFSYIIVDRERGTRTCVHTPSEPLAPEEMTHERVEAALTGASLVYFDGCLTEAALVVARAARAKGIKVLVEAESLVPVDLGLNLEALLAEADYVFTSARYPQECTGESCLADALISLLGLLPRAEWMLTTLGTRGSVLLQRHKQGAEGCEEARLTTVMDDLLAAAQGQAISHQQPGCTSQSGIRIGAGAMKSTEGPMKLLRSRPWGTQSSAAAKLAAATAAATHADSNTAGFSSYQEEQASPSAESTPSCCASVTVACAASIPQDAIQDTTGAGDAFLGAVLYSLCTGLQLAKAMRLAAVVAACKCTELGPRPGLPRRADLDPDMLQ